MLVFCVTKVSSVCDARPDITTPCGEVGHQSYKKRGRTVIVRGGWGGGGGFSLCYLRFLLSGVERWLWYMYGPDFLGVTCPLCLLCSFGVLLSMSCFWLAVTASYAKHNVQMPDLSPLWPPHYQYFTDSSQLPVISKWLLLSPPYQPSPVLLKDDIFLHPPLKPCQIMTPHPNHNFIQTHHIPDHRALLYSISPVHGFPQPPIASLPALTIARGKNH